MIRHIRRNPYTYGHIGLCVALVVGLYFGGAG